MFSLILSRPSHSLSDASLELCVMPKDEDILQLVSVHSSTNIANVRELGKSFFYHLRFLYQTTDFIKM